MKRLLAICLIGFSLNVVANSNVMMKMPRLLMQISQMNEEEKRSPATIAKIKQVFTETCIHGAKEAANKDIANGQVDQGQVTAIMQMVKQKCACVAGDPTVIKGFFSMANFGKQNKNIRAAQQSFQNDIQAAMQRCMQQSQ